MRVLVLEDDENTLVAVVASLRGAGLAVDAATDLRSAEFSIDVNDYDCVVLDRMVPGGDALDLVRRKRYTGWQVPVLFLTALDEVTARLEGLQVGVCDYVVKPFDMDELVARVFRMCRWRRPSPVRPLQCGDLVLDPARREVRRAGALLTLTKKEFDVLALLLGAQPDAVSTAELIRRCWDEVDPEPNRVQVLIAQLRKKLHKPEMIYNVRGYGYRITPA